MARRSRLAARRQAVGLSQATLADALTVRRVDGDRRAVATSTVAAWERGTASPRPWWRPPLAAELNVSLDELDDLLLPDVEWPAADSVRTDVEAARVESLGLDYVPSIPDTLDAVDKLGHADMERRAFLQGTLFAVGASVAPSRDWLLATIDEATAPTRKVSTSQVDAIRHIFSVFQELDVMRGGGYARHQLAAYLTSSVTPLLRSNDASTDAGRALYEAGAEQLYLIGWMAFDDGEDTLAQRYLIQALRLTQEAQSAELGAHVLAGLADQANLTGHPDHALQLARAGRAGLKRGNSPACLADLWALQARAEASLGEPKAVAHSVLESQQAADEIDPVEEPEWARFIPGAYLHGEYANAFWDVDKRPEATEFAALSAEEAARQNRARRGSLAYATLTRAALANHDLDAATAAATSTVELAATVRSSRSIEAVSDLRTRLAPHTASPGVTEFFDLADALIPA